MHLMNLVGNLESPVGLPQARVRRYYELVDRSRDMPEADTKIDFAAAGMMRQGEDTGGVYTLDEAVYDGHEWREQLPVVLLFPFVSCNTSAHLMLHKNWTAFDGAQGMIDNCVSQGSNAALVDVNLVMFLLKFVSCRCNPHSALWCESTSRPG
eukprot:scaffold126836_cov23-Tisochrysis_lutea.AAC.1